MVSSEVPGVAVITNLTPVRVWKHCSTMVSVSRRSIPIDKMGATYVYRGRGGSVVWFIDLK